MKKEYVLDACGLIAFLSDEEGSEKVESLLKKAERKEHIVYMHQINVLEVYYGIYREVGKDKAEEAYDRRNFQIMSEKGDSNNYSPLPVNGCDSQYFVRS
jgi:predicted nucleic acid-binding protein